MDIASALQVPQEQLDSLSLIISPLLSWYQGHKREMPWRNRPEPYFVWVSEIMLQQTRVETVRDYFSRFIAAYPTIEDLAAAKEEELLKLWEGLGYYNRARNLWKGAQLVLKDFQGRLPANVDQLKSIPGIGDYTAGAIASLAFRINVPAIDGNVYRVVSRLLGSVSNVQKSKTRDAYFHLLAPLIPTNQPGDFNQSLMELGALVCRPNGYPFCQSCPLTSFCASWEEEWVVELPVKNKSKKPLKEKRTLLFFRDESTHKLLLVQRPDKGLLSGLWEPVNLPGKLSKKEVARFLAPFSLSPYTLEKLSPSTHLFSHLHWELSAWQISTMHFPYPKGHWVSSLKNHAFPQAFKAYRPSINIFFSQELD